MWTRGQHFMKIAPLPKSPFVKFAPINLKFFSIGRYAHIRNEFIEFEIESWKLA